MIISFEIEDAKDLELLLQITKRLNIKRIDNSSLQAIEFKNTLNLREENDTNSINEINDDITSIFGDNTDSSLPFGS